VRVFIDLPFIGCRTPIFSRAVLGVGWKMLLAAFYSLNISAISKC
jgi:hypothetical protein